MTVDIADIQVHVARLEAAHARSDEPFFTIAELVEMTGKSSRTLRRRIAARPNGAPTLRRGRKLRYRLSDLGLS